MHFEISHLAYAMVKFFFQGPYAKQTILNAIKILFFKDILLQIVGGIVLPLVTLKKAKIR